MTKIFLNKNFLYNNYYFNLYDYLECSGAKTGSDERTAIQSWVVVHIWLMQIAKIQNIGQSIREKLLLQY